MGRSIVWLASYPKSGNTWLRAMLTQLLYAPGDDFTLDALVGGIDGGDRQALDDGCAISSAEMTAAELLPYRALLHRQMAEDAPAPYFVKTHDQYALAADGTALFPADASRAAVYIVRNPLDVVVSFAHHRQKPIDDTVAYMADEARMLNVWPDRASDLLPVHLGSWSAHVAGWTRQRDIPLCVLRYEDMLADPAAALSRVAAIAGIDASPEAISSAVAASSFERLQAIESAAGFAEKPPNLGRFFRRGRADEWTAHLTREQVATLVAEHRETMAQWGY